MILVRATHSTGRSILIKAAAMASSLYYYLLFFDFTTYYSERRVTLFRLFGLLRQMCKWIRIQFELEKFPSLFFSFFFLLLLIS